LHFYQAIPRLRKERKELVKNDSKINDLGTYKKSIVFDFFRGGKRFFSDLEF
jgi:hypothetical protein